MNTNYDYQFSNPGYVNTQQNYNNVSTYDNQNYKISTVDRVVPAPNYTNAATVPYSAQPVNTYAPPAYQNYSVNETRYVEAPRQVVTTQVVQQPMVIPQQTQVV